MLEGVGEVCVCEGKWVRVVRYVFVEGGGGVRVGSTLV